MSITLPNFALTAVQNPTVTNTNIDNLTTKTLILTDYIAKNDIGLIVYFYPKDNTAGCSVQAQDFSEHKDAFAKLGYHIIGVSRDSVKSHQKFIINKAINFALISDSDETLCQYFGVIGEKKLYGKTSLGVVRSTFVFDKNAKLQHELRNVRAKGHVQKLFDLLQQS
ncbi:peroxiredoxin [Faucicola mancuniensis]|uniref:peroxiredoxin n=1 Tax=Faucicola mancuniensis TaxID=1309795 RepID=UPI0039777838